MKGANKYMEISLVVFWEKIHLGQFDLFSLKVIFLLFYWAWSNWARPLLIGSLNSQDIISFMIATRSLNSQDMIRILKQWRHDFSGKHLFGGYCSYVMFMCGDQNSWFCKASLKICYISLCEGKGPWMLKTVINCHVRNRRLQN